MTIPIFVGYDDREAVAYSVFCHSVMSRTRSRVAFYPMRGEKIEGSTTFNAQRFEVAREMGYTGWAIWADGDMLCRADIAELMDYADSSYDVVVAKHDYKTKHPVKFLGQPNADYPRKNWSSLMLINCANASWKRLHGGPAYTLADRHRFKFIEDGRVGELPLEWNWLVSEYDYNPDAKLVHYTVGTPCWEEYADCDYADEWHDERALMLNFAPSAEQRIAA
jgi:hypothetical protein